MLFPRLILQGFVWHACHFEWHDVSRKTLASSMEQDMIAAVTDPKDNSRLSCQVIVTEDMDGMVVSLPASQF